jgi:hypothetical protein
VSCGGEKVTGRGGPAPSSAFAPPAGVSNAPNAGHSIRAAPQWQSAAPVPRIWCLFSRPSCRLKPVLRPHGYHEFDLGPAFGAVAEMARLWAGWRSALLIVQPGTVVRWHRQGFRLYWRWKSRKKQGSPNVDRAIRDLIRRMCRDSPTWGVPRILSELLLAGGAKHIWWNSPKTVTGMRPSYAFQAAEEILSIQRVASTSFGTTHVAAPGIGSMAALSKSDLAD